MRERDIDVTATEQLSNGGLNVFDLVQYRPRPSGAPTSGGEAGTLHREPQRSRRWVMRALGAAAVGVASPVVLAPAACAPGGQAKPAPATGGVQELTFMDWSSIENTPTETVLKNFQAKFSHIRLQVDPTPQDYETKMRALIAAGTPSDIHRINDDYVRAYAVNGLLLDLMPYIKRDKVRREEFFEFIYDFPIHEGKYWAWSTGNQPRPLFINKTLFQNAGVQAPLFDKWDPAGWTWEDMIAAAQKLTKDPTGERPTFGVSIYHDTGYEQTFLVNFGVEDGIYSKDGKRFVMATPAGIEAIQQVVDLDCKLRVQRPFNHREGGAGVSANTLFVQGRLGMIFSPVTNLLTFRRDIRDNFDWSVAPVPKKAKRMTEGSLIVYCVPKDAKNPDPAWQLLNYMASDEGGRVFGETLFYVPVRKSAAPFYRLPAGDKPERVNLIVESMNFNTAVNYTNNTERARNIYRPELERKAYICAESVKTTLDGVKKAVEDALVGAF